MWRMTPLGAMGEAMRPDRKEITRSSGPAARPEEIRRIAAEHDIQICGRAGAIVVPLYESSKISNDFNHKTIQRSESGFFLRHAPLPRLEHVAGRSDIMAA